MHETLFAAAASRASLGAAVDDGSDCNAVVVCALGFDTSARTVCGRLGKKGLRAGFDRLSPNGFG
jgi:hypothetical protein